MAKQHLFLIKYTITYLLNIQKAERSEIASTDGRKQNKQMQSQLSQKQKNPVKYRYFRNSIIKN